MVCITREGAHSVTRLLLNQHVLQTKVMMVHHILACQPCICISVKRRHFRTRCKLT